MSDSSFLTKLGKMLQRTGSEEPTDQAVLKKASKIKLNFQPLPSLLPSISWLNKLPLQDLAGLPRGGLSGPVQEDKADVHSILVKLIDVKTRFYNQVDLREVNGICSYTSEDPEQTYLTLEELSMTEEFRRVRIISFNDFSKAVAQFLPDTNTPVELCRAAWHGPRLYWKGDKSNNILLTNIVVYARRRGLELMYPANITSYSVNEQALDELAKDYQVLNMPDEAWSNDAFMSLLLDTELAYSRLPMRINHKKVAEWILLPNNNPKSYALGFGLRLAGAYDVISYLRSIDSIQKNFDSMDYD
jgi:hypothetical protein